MARSNAVHLTNLCLFPLWLSPKASHRALATRACDMASSRSRRQMIQRMGRVVRRKQDGRVARIAVLYVEGTSEDPHDGAHEDFLDAITGAADDVRYFGADTPSGFATAYLNDFQARASDGRRSIVSA